MCLLCGVIYLCGEVSIRMVGSRVIVVKNDIVILIVRVGLIVENILSLVNFMLRKVILIVVVDVVIIFLMDIIVCWMVCLGCLLSCIYL